MLRRLLAIPLHRPRATLAVMLAITVVFGAFAPRIKVDSSIENLLPRDDPDRVYYREVRDLFGSEEITVIGVFADDVYAPATLAKIDHLSEQLATIEGVHEVLSLTTMKGAEMGELGLRIGRLMRAVPTTPAEAAAFRAKVEANPIYLGNVVSRDGRAAGISVLFETIEDEHTLRAIEDRIRILVAELKGPEQFAITGIPTIKVNGARMMEGDTQTFMPLALLLVVVILYITFRTMRGVLIPLSAVVIGVVWTTGVMVLCGSAITMGTLVLNPLLMVVGVASGIHLMSQYYLELKPDRTPAAVVAATMHHVRVPVAIASLTTLIGFATLIFTPIPAIREFGVYSVLGILFILIASFTVIPAALSLMPLPAPGRLKSPEGGHVVRGLQSLGAFAVRQRRLVLLCGVLVLMVSVWGITKIRVATDYLSFFSPSSTIRQDNALISSRLAGTQPIYIAIDGDRPGAITRLPTLAAIRALQEFVDQQPSVDKTVSLIDYLDLVRGVLQPDAAKGNATSQSEIDQILLFVNPADLRAVATPDFSRGNMIARTTLSGSTEVGAFVAAVQAFAAEHFPPDIHVRPTGTVVLLNQSADALVWGQVTGIWQELFALWLLLAFLFLSLRVGLLALIPNVIPTVILFGIMGWTGITLNVSTSMIAAIAIGIAIDDTIHLLSSFNAELRRSGSQEQAVLYAIRSAGQAAVFISIALAAGFFIVCLSNFQPVQHFGLLSGVTMGVALITELFFTPALLATTKIVTLWDLLFLKLGPDPHKQISLFAGLRPFQAKIATLMAHLAAANSGDLLTRRGEMKAEMYVLLSGRAEVRSPDGVVLRKLGRGDVLGEMGLVRKQPRSADVIIAEAADYLVLDERFLRRLRRQYPRIAATVFLNLTRILSDRLESTTEQLTGESGRR